MNGTRSALEVTGRVRTRRSASACAVAAVAGALLWGGQAPALQAQDTRPGASAPRPPSRISLALIDVPLVEALETLSRQAQLNLVWQAGTLGPRGMRRISCRLEGVLPEDALVCVTRAAGLDFVRLSSGTYVVIAGAEQPASWGAFAGRVLDAASGEPLPQARVQLAEVPDAVLSADDGGFSFARLRPGTYELQVRAVGYRPHRETFELPPNGSRLVRLPLVRTETVARPIIVNGLRAGALSATLGSTVVADSVARRTLMGPSLFLPGAPVPLGLSRRDGTADLHLQGGDIGEHPWRLDGIPLYDLTALSGLLGLVPPVAIDELAVRRSGYRASEGSFATGVIDLKHAVGGESAGGADVHVDPIAASGRWSLPVTVGGARGTVMVAGRTGLWQWTAPPALTRALRHWSVPDPVLLARLSDFGAQPGMAGLDGAAFSSSVGDERVRLHDVHTAGRLQFGVAHTLSASAFLNEHGVSYLGAADDGAGRTLRTADRYDKRTMGGQLSHQWLLGTRVRQSLQLRASQYELGHGGSMGMNAAPLAGTTATESNALTELAASGEWRVRGGARTDLTFGAEVVHDRAHLDLSNRVLRPLAYKTMVTRGTLVADVTRQLSATHFLDAGMRITQLQTGRTYAEPRLALRGEQRWDARTFTWRVAGGGYHQFVNQFDVASTMPVAFVPSVRFWLPSDGNAPVAQAWHLAGEGAYSPAPGWELRGELYARWHPTLPMFDYGVMYGPGLTPNVLTDAAQFIRPMSGQAFGGGVRLLREASWRGKAMRTELAYDGGSSVRRYPSRFDDRLQPTPWLEPHRVLLASEVRPARGLVMAVRTRGVWGRPWALRQVYYDLFGAAPMTSQLPVSMPGVMRRPALIDVDLGLTWQRDVGTTRMELGASMLNVIGRSNVLDYGLRRGADGTYTMVPRFLPMRQPALTVRLLY